MSETYTVRDVREGKVKPNPHGGGNLQAFYVDFVRPDGKLEMGVYWQRKEGNAPQPEESVFGDITEGDYGPRFKQAKGGPSHNESSTGNAPGSSSGRTPGSGPGNGGSNPSPGTNGTDWEVRNAEIRRQHSQEMSVRVHGYVGAFSAELNQAGISDLTKSSIAVLADWFDQDAIAAGQKASQGAASTSGSPHSSPPPQGAAPDSFSAGEEHQWLENLLIQGGASTYGAGKLANFALEELSPENLKKCEALLSNLDSQVEGRERLETSYTKAKGEPVPQVDPIDDDLLF